MINPLQLNTWYRLTFTIDDLNLFQIEVHERDGGPGRGSYSHVKPAGKQWTFHQWIQNNTAYLDNYTEFFTGLPPSPTPTPTSTATATPTATPSGVTIHSAWTADDADATKSTFNPGETVRYYGELYNGTGITQTVNNQWQAWGTCGWLVNQATNESVSPTTNLWHIAAPLPTGNCGGVYTYTLGVTYNSVTTTQSVTFTVTGPTPTPTPTGVEQVAIDYAYDPLYRLTRATYTGSFAKSYVYTYRCNGLSSRNFENAQDI